MEFNYFTEIVITIILMSPVIAGVAAILSLFYADIKFKKQAKKDSELMEKFLKLYGYNELNLIIEACKESNADITDVMKKMIDIKLN